MYLHGGGGRQCSAEVITRLFTPKSCDKDPHTNGLIKSRAKHNSNGGCL